MVSNPTIWKDYGDIKKSASVYIPYNYETKIKSLTMSSDTTLYLGESASVAYSIEVGPRQNSGVSGSAYATITHDDTRYYAIEFLIAPNAEYTSESNLQGSRYSSKDPCSYYLDKITGSSNCNVFDQHYGTLNSEGEYNYVHNFVGTSSAVRTIPDSVEVGTKYCVAVGVYPSDSHHDINGSVMDNIWATDISRGNDYSWNVSGAVCRTISKKPNFQVWGGSTYVNGTVTTSVSSRDYGAYISNPRGNIINFGSRDEYAILATSDVLGMGSAASYGYNAFFIPPGGAVNGSDPVNLMTIAKNGTGKEPGSLGSLGGNSNVYISSPLLSRLRSRYLVDKGTSDQAFDCAAIGFSAVSGSVSCYKLENGSIYAYASGSARIGSSLIARAADPADTASGTYVFNVENGALTVAGDLCYGTCTLNKTTYAATQIDYQSGNTLDVYSENYDSVSALPQILLFAQNINIEPNVTQLDAWLIAATGSGTINTCSTFRLDVPRAVRPPMSVADASTNSANACNLTFTVNGPVLAKNLVLRRTAGALQDVSPYLEADGTANPTTHNLANDGAVTPGEIFNLRPDTYFWAFAQSGRYSQAIVTYSRELAPRY